ncbi:hypothetical protein RchiOBHm_Chr2g0104131 [Rosa chinensis]|uniref:Uncharacterized protein n=1 Tax=Rosa chinensis TaxID=74649 RepID=A0A2P6RN40_ROSCH|nr:hypothetical protein RchiOBHm_Chr2g0104131 [Rosa chinensis]
MPNQMPTMKTITMKKVKMKEKNKSYHCFREVCFFSMKLFFSRLLFLVPFG